MPLPLGVLRAATDQPLMVELKNGDTLSGLLESCDGYMNLRLKNLVCTSHDGEQFLSMETCYVRGNNVKFIRIEPSVLDLAIEQQQKKRETATSNNDSSRGKRRWGTTGRGRGGGSSRQQAK